MSDTPGFSPAEHANTSTVLVLGSASPARAKTLRAAGIEPLIRVSNADEDAVLAQFENATSAHQAAQKVMALAKVKAASVAQALTATEIADFSRQQGMPAPASAIVVGCDSMLEVNGALVGKPHSPEVAVSRIRELSGNDVVLHTGHAITLLHVEYDSATSPGGSNNGPTGLTILDTRYDSCATTVHFTDLDEDEIRAYVATGEPLEVAGAFTIDSLGGAFIAGVTGDPHSVVGISLPLLRQITKELGVFWPGLWNKQRAVATHEQGEGLTPEILRPSLPLFG